MGNYEMALLKVCLNLYEELQHVVMKWNPDSLACMLRILITLLLSVEFAFAANIVIRPEYFPLTVL